MACVSKDRHRHDHDLNATYVAIAIAVAHVPASSNGAHPPGRHLAGIALFIAERDEHGSWRFARRAHAIAADEPEPLLLAWATDRLPVHATLIGWNVDHAVVPVLLEVAAAATPTAACLFLDKLGAVLRGGVVDLALEHGGAGAPPLAGIAADMAIYAPVMEADAVGSAWAIGHVDQLRRDLAAEALALWRVFIRTAGIAGLDAEAATDAWVLRRQQMNAVAVTSKVA